MAQLFRIRRRSNATPALLLWLDLRSTRSARSMLDAGLPSILTIITFPPSAAGLSYTARMPVLSHTSGTGKAPCDQPGDPTADNNFSDTIFAATPQNHHDALRSRIRCRGYRHPVSRRSLQCKRGSRQCGTALFATSGPSARRLVLGIEMVSCD
jgi:hypothetical protein